MKFVIVCSIILLCIVGHVYPQIDSLLQWQDVHELCAGRVGSYLEGPRQKTVCSLGNLTPRPRDEWLKLARKIEDALIGQSDLLGADDPAIGHMVGRMRARRRNHVSADAERAPPVSAPYAGGGALIKIDPSRVSTERHREAGPVHVGHQFWQRLDLDRILCDCKLSRAVRRLACAMTLNRLIAPSSELAMPDWIRRTALADILGVGSRSATAGLVTSMTPKASPPCCASAPRSTQVRRRLRSRSRPVPTVSTPTCCAGTG